MKRPLCITLILLCLFATSCATSTKSVQAPSFQTPALSYAFDLNTKNQQPCLTVSVSFSGNQWGKDILQLPNQWGGQTELYNSLKNFKTLTADVKIENTNDPSRKIITYPVNKDIITLQYDVYPSIAAAQKIWRSYYRPMIEKNFFHMIGETVFVHPDWDFNKKVSIAFHWKNFQNNWHVANSFGAEQKTQRITASLQEIKYALYTGGAVRLHKETINGNNLFLAVKGKWGFSDEDLSALIKNSLTTERNFWNDHHYPHYFVSLVPSGQPLGHYAGISLTNSFVLFLSTHEKINLPLKHLVTHELFHQWNGLTMKRAQPEELVFWFSEGFTEYYARLLNLRAGIISLSEYVESYNLVLKDYYSSSVKFASNEHILGHFWNNKDVSRLPYVKGEILAHNWDHKLRQKSDNRISLDNVMRDLYKAALTENRTISDDNVNEHMAKYIPGGVKEDLHRFIDAGNLIQPLAENLGPCVKLTSQNSIPQYVLDESYFADHQNQCLDYFE